LRSTGLIADSFMAIFTASGLGAAVLATLFHLVRSLERRQ
jgi:protein-L-isoaspartate O-methyltransferase